LSGGATFCLRQCGKARGQLPVRQVVERLAAGMGLTARLAVQPSPKPAFLLSSALQGGATKNIRDA